MYSHRGLVGDGLTDWELGWFAGYVLTQQVMDSMDQYMASAADTVVTKAKSICTAFPGVRAQPGDPPLIDLSDPERDRIIIL